MKKQDVKTGQCMGVPGRVAPHEFQDGLAHHPGSHGLCPKCQLIMIAMIERRYRQKAMLVHAARVA